MRGHIHLDVVGGISGDMFIAALLDAWPQLTDELVATIRCVNAPTAINARLSRHNDNVLTGSIFHVETKDLPSASVLRHTPLGEVQQILKNSPLPSEIVRHSINLFNILAKAESSVHGVEIDQVGFHEVGAIDSIADVVGASFLIRAMKDCTWSCGPLPIGTGRVTSAHGVLPVPAPAVSLLLKGRPVFQDAVEGERVTPTGAAILEYIDPDHSLARPPMRLANTGIGFGSRRLEGISNILRVLAFDSLSTDALSDEITVVQFEVDDQAPEDLAIGLDHLRVLPGVLDVVQSPVHGKKGRIAAHIQILVQTDDLESVITRCFEETTTLGLRWNHCRRRVLPRHSRTILVDNHTLRVKYAERPDGTISGKIEADDLAETRGGVTARSRLRNVVENKSKPKRDSDD